MRQLDTGRYEGRRFSDLAARELIDWLVAPHSRWRRRRRWAALARWCLASAQVRSALPGDWLTIPALDIHLLVVDCKPHGLVCRPITAQYLAGTAARLLGLQGFGLLIGEGSYVTFDGQGQLRRLTVAVPAKGLWRWQRLHGAQRLTQADLDRMHARAGQPPATAA